jgi:hypothetical protein
MENEAEGYIQFKANISNSILNICLSKISSFSLIA